MEKTFSKIEHKTRRHKRIRAKIIGSAKRPRLCVFRSNQHIYAQLIDDQAKKVLGAISDFEIKKPASPARLAAASAQRAGGSKTAVKDKDGGGLQGKTAIAYKVGQKVADLAKEKNIEKIVFDRGGYQYHGRIKALADGARAKGLKF